MLLQKTKVDKHQYILKLKKRNCKSNKKLIMTDDKLYYKVRKVSGDVHLIRRNKNS